jgi:hypothetical protein
MYGMPMIPFQNNIGNNDYLKNELNNIKEELEKIEKELKEIENILNMNNINNLSTNANPGKGLYML